MLRASLPEQEPDSLVYSPGFEIYVLGRVAADRYGLLHMAQATWCGLPRPRRNSATVFAYGAGIIGWRVRRCQELLAAPSHNVTEPWTGRSACPAGARTHVNATGDTNVQ